MKKRTLHRSRSMVSLDNLRERLVHHVAKGVPIGQSFTLVGVSRFNYRSWLRRATRFEQAMFDQEQEEDVSDEKYYILFRDLRQAEAQFLADLIKRSFCDPSELENKRLWKRDLSVLERRDKANWSRESTKRLIQLDEEHEARPDDRFI